MLACTCLHRLHVLLHWPTLPPRVPPTVDGSARGPSAAPHRSLGLFWRKGAFLAFLLEAAPRQPSHSTQDPLLPTENRIAAGRYDWMMMAGIRMTSLVFLMMALIALSGISPASSQSWHSFQRKHMDNSVQNGDNNYCNTMIGTRRITDRGLCKFRNTFIHAAPDTIKGLCAGMIGSIHSNNPYKITDCRHKPLNNNEKPPNCNYRFEDKIKRISIKCEHSEPVHFERLLNN